MWLKNEIYKFKKYIYIYIYIYIFEKHECQLLEILMLGNLKYQKYKYNLEILKLSITK